MYSRAWSRDIVARFRNSAPRAQDFEREYLRGVERYRDRGFNGHVGNPWEACALCIAMGIGPRAELAKLWRKIKRLVSKNALYDDEAREAIDELIRVEACNGYTRIWRQGEFDNLQSLHT